MIFARPIGSQRVVIECDSSLAPAVGEVFETLAGLHRAGTTLRDGLRIRFGWSMLILASEEEGGLRACEPLFSGDPQQDLSRTVDLTLRILASQVGWLHLLGEEGEDAFFDQQIVATPDALRSAAIFALRGKHQPEADSGWSVARVPAPGETIDTSHLLAVPVYRLAASHPGLLSILTLPEGYLVRLENDKVVEITGPEGDVRWPEEPSRAGTGLVN